jgi:mannose-6-phosphate isomerase
VDRTPWDGQRLAAVRRSAAATGTGSSVTALLPSAADSFFRADWLRPGDGLRLDAGYAVWIVASGRGALRTEHGGALELRQGMTVLVAYGDGPASLTGAVEVIRCRPPAPG